MKDWHDTPTWATLTQSQKDLFNDVITNDGPLIVRHPTYQQRRDAAKLVGKGMVAFRAIADGAILTEVPYSPRPHTVTFSRAGETVTGILLPPEPSDTSARLLGVTERDISISELLREKDIVIDRLRKVVAEQDELHDLYGRAFSAINEALQTILPDQATADNDFIEAAQPVPKGTPVVVYSPDGVRAPLFSGRLTGAGRYASWSRVVPDDGYVDLPPSYKVERTGP